MKITSRCGERAVAGLNDALLTKAAENKVIKTDKVRADTTVVEANVAYPTDSGLLAKGVARMVVIIAGLHALGDESIPQVVLDIAAGERVVVLLCGANTNPADLA